MAFFDEMDRKLSQFGQSVSNKSREVSEGMRLSSAIKAEEEKQNNLYREVGNTILKIVRQMQRDS